MGIPVFMGQAGNVFNCPGKGNVGAEGAYKTV